MVLPSLWITDALQRVETCPVTSHLGRTSTCQPVTQTPTIPYRLDCPLNHYCSEQGICSPKDLAQSSSRCKTSTDCLAGLQCLRGYCKICEQDENVSYQGQEIRGQIFSPARCDRWRGKWQ